MIRQGSTKDNLMQKIQSYDFMVYDLLLYLDAYPDCREAMESYNKYARLAREAKGEYERKYGHITAPNETASWNWTDGPWPWQLEERR